MTVIKASSLQVIFLLRKPQKCSLKSAWDHSFFVLIMVLSKCIKNITVPIYVIFVENFYGGAVDETGEP